MYYKLLVYDSKNKRKATKQRTTEKINNLSGSTRKSGFMMEKGLHNEAFKEDWAEIFLDVTDFLLRIAGDHLLLFLMKKLFKGKLMQI